MPSRSCRACEEDRGGKLRHAHGEHCPPRRWLRESDGGSRANTGGHVAQTKSFALVRTLLERYCRLPVRGTTPCASLLRPFYSHVRMGGSVVPDVCLASKTSPNQPPLPSVTRSFGCRRAPEEAGPVVIVASFRALRVKNLRLHGRARREQSKAASGLYVSDQHPIDSPVPRFPPFSSTPVEQIATP
jgi:hypothetical protein